MIHYDKRILDNGLTVVAEQDTTTNMCAVNVLYKVGSRDEEADRTGFAHLFEHLMFCGTHQVPDFDTPLQNAGGENNAFTNTDYTNFYDLVPAKNIEVALWLEADRMMGLDINQKSLSVQQKVVIEEFKEVCLNKPYGDSWHHLAALAYQDHAYSWPTIGKNIDHIANAHLSEVRSFYDHHYHPSNAILTVSGPLAVDSVFRLAEKWFGKIKVDSYSVSKPSVDVNQEEERFTGVDADVPSPLFLLGYHMPGRNSQAYYACDLLSDVLANGKSSRFYTSLIRGKQLFSSLDCYVTGTFEPGLIIIEGRPMPGVSIQEALEAVQHEIQTVVDDPPADRELQKVKNKVISSLAISDLNVLNKAISMAYFEWLDSLDLMNQQERLYEQVTAEDIVDMTRSYLRASNRSIVEYRPTAEVSAV
ncbi:MAG: pitrilysin family protein [Bacteroidota bacterium]